MVDYVFSLGLIPVQEWIAQARRSRDLRAGSVFLWHVMAKLLDRLEKEFAAVEVWTPQAPEGGFGKLAGLAFGAALGEVSYGIPNRASGIFQATDEKDLVHIFQGLEREVVMAWDGLRDLALTRLKKESSPAFWSALASHWEAYRGATSNGEDCPLTLIWVAEPAPYPRANRKENLEEIDSRFADLKRSRPLRGWGLGAPVGKCSQCGRREAIGPQSSFEKWQDWHGRRSEDPWIQQGQRLDAGERLCYVCLVRRIAGYATQREFPSTGEIAARPWLARLRNVPHLRRLAGRLERTALGNLDFGRALYGSVEALPKPELDEVLGLRDEIREGIREQNRRPVSKNWPSPLSPTPPRYLALLTFDGDNMGRQVQADPHGTPRALARFAEAAASLLEKNQATPFYLAGDEGLAMAPAETALDLAFALREAFSTALEDLDPRPTLSVGIAFFEQGRPMRGAILAARGALEDAKSIENKNALGVAVETASGSRWGFTARWGDDWQRVHQAAVLIREGRLSAGWAYDAERFLETIPAGEWGPEVAGAARVELRRLFLRRMRAKKKDAGHEWLGMPGGEWWPVDERGVTAPPDPQQFHLIGFLARQGSTRPAGVEEE